MKQLKIKLRKESLVKTILLRIFFYTVLISVATLLLYLMSPLINQNSIYFLPYTIIIILIIIIFQYLIYSSSLNKKISRTHFKNTLTENELDNPIKLLFPEFELLYNLEDSFNDRIDSDELKKIASTAIDEEKSLKVEKEFKNFIKKNMDNLLDYDVVIKMKRKGEAIFDDLVDEFPELEKLVPLTNYSVIYEDTKIKNRKILIFDDSIHQGNSAREIINFVKNNGYSKILYLSIIAQESSLEHLKIEYPENENITFLQYEIKKENEYRKFYADYIFGYLDHVNSQLEKDNTSVRLKIDRSINPDDLKNLFKEKGNYIYEVERLVGKDTEKEYKMSLECPWIYEKLKGSFYKKIKMDMVKVRFFVKLNRSSNVNSTEINLSPILIPRDFNTNFCNKRKVSKYCMLDKILDQVGDDFSDRKRDEIKDLICINCLLNNITKDFINEFMEYFEKILKEKYNANIIEKNITYPLPNEIYPDIISKLQEEEE